MLTRLNKRTLRVLNALRVACFQGGVDRWH
jgi:hypothetical protein